MAAKFDGDSWLDLQRKREERMRYEVLAMLYRAADGHVGREINCWNFATQLGVWHAEVFRVLEFLDRKGLVQYRGAGPVVCLTEEGKQYIDSGRGDRKSVRD